MDSEEKLKIAAQFRQLAELSYQNQNLSDACFYYINCLKILPEWKEELKKRFIIVLSCLGQLFEKQQHFSEIFTLYEEALKLYENCEEIHHNLGAHLLRLGHPDKAVFYFKEALIRNNNYFPAYRSLHSTYCALVERWHYRMLNDSFRNESYREAILKKVRQGFDTVLDIGTGTGLFCLYAYEAGAKMIFGCDCNPVMLSIASNVLSTTAVSDRIKLIDKHSNSITVPEDLPERVTLVVTETMDSCLLGEHILQTLKYAWDNLLFPPPDVSCNKSTRSGVVIPHSGSLWFSAVQSKLLASKYVFPTINDDAEECINALANISLDESLPDNFHNLDIRGMELNADLNEPYDTERLQLFPDCVFLTEPQQLFHINFNSPEDIEKCLCSKNKCLLEITCIQGGYLHAIAAWFKVNLDDDIVLCSAPNDSNSKNCCWDQAIFPCEKLYGVLPGSKIFLLSEWTNGRVTLKVHKVDHPIYNPQTCKLLQKKAPTRFITMLNDINLLKHLKQSAVEFIKQFNGKQSLNIIDLFCIPIFALTILRNLHLMKDIVSEIKLCCVVQSLADRDIINYIATLNGISLNNIHYFFPDDFDVLIIQMENKIYDVVMMNFLDNEGDLSEDAICRINSISSLLKPEGLLLPKRLEVCAQLIHSDYIEENMRVVNNSMYQCGIAPAINELQVSQMIGINIASLKFEKYSSTFTCYQFLPNSLDSEFLKEFTTNVVRHGTVNSILYWYNIHFYNEHSFYSTLDEFSFVPQAAFLTDQPFTFEKNNYATVRFVYHHGAFLINLLNK